MRRVLPTLLILVVAVVIEAGLGGQCGFERHTVKCGWRGNKRMEMPLTASYSQI